MVDDERIARLTELARHARAREGKRVMLERVWHWFCCRLGYHATRHPVRVPPRCDFCGRVGERAKGGEHG